MRQIVLDTETTGLEPAQGHRIIEIGCVEVVNRKLTGRHYHQYINPERVVDDGAIEVHGITNEFLVDKPVFSQIAQEFFDFIKGADLVIHNAPFDVGFIDHEFGLLFGAGGPNFGKVHDSCSVTDTLVMAREKHPGQKNNLDALCKRYFVDNSQRDLHGALLDAEILADVYLIMTGGQTDLTLSTDAEASESSATTSAIRRLSASRPRLKVVTANSGELEAHQAQIEKIGDAIWTE